MSHTTQYPDGPYLVTNDEGYYAAGVLCTDAGQNRYLPGIGTLNGLLGDGCTLTPLVPAQTEPTLNEMIMQLLALLHPGIDNNWMCSYAKPGEYYSQSYYGATPEAAVRACWEAVCKHE